MLRIWKNDPIGLKEFIWNTTIKKLVESFIAPKKKKIVIRQTIVLKLSRWSWS